MYSQRNIQYCGKYRSEVRGHLVLVLGALRNASNAVIALGEDDTFETLLYMGRILTRLNLRVQCEADDDLNEEFDKLRVDVLTYIGSKYPAIHESLLSEVVNACTWLVLADKVLGRYSDPIDSIWWIMLSYSE